ncbi:unnamed protein product [Brassica oleracea var. botrytis]
MKNSCTSLIMSLPTIPQLDWKKHAENPSGPGAFSKLMEKRASLISSASEAWKKPVFLSPRCSQSWRLRCFQ